MFVATREKNIKRVNIDTDTNTNTNTNTNMEGTLDDDWIDKFDRVDELYKDFYKDDVYYVGLKLLYVNRGNDLEKIKETTFLMSKPNCITREEILQILKDASLEGNKRWSLLSILKYNIVLGPEEIKSYLSSDCSEEYLTKIKHIDTIYFERTVNMFQDLNDLILIFYEKSTEIKNPDVNKCTKRIRIEAKKKTIKKQYKD